MHFATYAWQKVFLRAFLKEKILKMKKYLCISFFFRTFAPIYMYARKNTSYFH